MTTRIYGCSDDLIEFEGDITGEVGAYGTKEKPVLLVVDDGTILRAAYGKPAGGVWHLELVRAGWLFDRIEVCTSEADSYSNVAYLRDGAKLAFACKQWERVQ